MTIKSAVLASMGVLVGALFVHFMTNVTQPDVIAYHQLDYPVALDPIRAGDIVAISADGLRLERICELNLDQAKLASQPIADLYFNDLGRQFSSFPELVGWVVAGFPADGAAKLSPSRDAMRFVGAKSSIREVNSAPNLSLACECEMARRLNARQRVCTAKATLIETILGPRHGDAPPETKERTVAITFASMSNLVPPERFRLCNLSKSDAAAQTEAQSCGSASRLPADVKLRRWLNLIEARQLDAS